jgi:protein-tyrosine phosphatase
MSFIDQVLPGLYIGSYETASDLETLRSNEITHILTVASNLPARFEGQFKYKIIEALDRDSEDLSESFSSSFEFIESSINPGGRVLVHCLYGISRSSTIVLSYLMQKLKLKFSEALSLLQSCHPYTDPSAAFIEQLMKLESYLVIII